MFERLKGLGKRDPERAAARKQRRADRAGDGGAGVPFGGGN